jgi:hypothetical protein
VGRRQGGSAAVAPVLPDSKSATAGKADTKKVKKESNFDPDHFLSGLHTLCQRVVHHHSTHNFLVVGFCCADMDDSQYFVTMASP